MITILSEVDGVPKISIGVEAALVNYVKAYGQIISLDKWAIELGLNPKWVRLCAHKAKEKRLIKMIREEKLPGRPYKIIAI